jgi:hypothetical protein
VGISSKPKNQLEYQTLEFINILKKIENIKQEVKEFGQDNSFNEISKLIMKVEQLEDSLIIQNRRINQFTRSIMTLSRIKLTNKQKTILRWLILQYTGPEVYTNLINTISDELNIPKSTVRWNMKGLRDAALIKAGTKEKKGIPVRLTFMGRIMAYYS